MGIGDAASDYIIVQRPPSTHSTVRDIACISVAKTILLLMSANRSFRHFHVYTFWQRTTHNEHLPLFLHHGAFRDSIPSGFWP